MVNITANKTTMPPVMYKAFLFAIPAQFFLYNLISFSILIPLL